MLFYGLCFHKITIIYWVNECRCRIFNQRQYKRDMQRGGHHRPTNASSSGADELVDLSATLDKQTLAHESMYKYLQSGKSFIATKYCPNTCSSSNTLPCLGRAGTITNTVISSTPKRCRLRPLAAHPSAYSRRIVPSPQRCSFPWQHSTLHTLMVDWWWKLNT